MTAFLEIIMETLGTLLAGLALCAVPLWVWNLLKFKQERKKWEREIRPGKGLGL